MQLPKISKNHLKTITKFFTTKTKLIDIKTKSLSPHIKTFAGIIVENVVKKADYAPDLIYLVNNWMSVKDAAKTLGINVSYAYKLLKKRS